MALKHILGNLPVIKILDFIIDNQLQDHTKKDIMEGAEIGPTAMRADFPNLLGWGIIFETRRVGGTGLYSLDMENEMTRLLIQFDDTLTDYCTDKAMAEADALGEGLPEPED